MLMWGSIIGHHFVAPRMTNSSVKVPWLVTMSWYGLWPVYSTLGFASSQLGKAPSRGSVVALGLLVKLDMQASTSTPDEAQTESTQVQGSVPLTICFLTLIPADVHRWTMVSPGTCRYGRRPHHLHGQQENFFPAGVRLRGPKQQMNWTCCEVSTLPWPGSGISKLYSSIASGEGAITRAG